MAIALVKTSGSATRSGASAWHGWLAVVLWAPVLLALTPASQAEEKVAAVQPQPAAANPLEGVSRWISRRFSDEEIRTLSPQDFRVEPHACNCSDQPDAHFPYLVVLFTTPKGDLVARAEGHENLARFTPLAVRNGNEYCQVDAEDQCYGSFASVCEFTDFRYGPALAPFFPTCKQ